ncbi:hypothetical protein ADL21_02320 [Streptomyces albus subsp. albus]|nr:hypothetical protein ADL21_02320 [Streptomyces albus subsp. albus]
MDRRNFVTASSGYALAALGLSDPDSITRRTENPPAGAVGVGKGEVAAGCGITVRIPRRLR